MKVQVELEDDKMKSTSDTGTDAEIGRHLVEVKAGVQSIRTLRDAIINLAYRLAESPSRNALLILPGLQVSQKRLAEEQAKALRAFRPEITRRLHLVVEEGDDLRGLPAGISRSDKQRLKDVIKQETLRHGERLPRIDGYFVILKLLLLEWLKKKPPVTAKWLSETSGYSYPTVAKAISRLSDSIRRHSDRRVELRSFPRGEWARLLAVSDQVRSTVCFADVSGQPRSLESLMRRLQELNRADIAVGGVYGAKHYRPELDLVGSPRLDLTMHCPHGMRDLSFVKRLDPGLETVDGPGKPARLVVHVLRGKESFFERGSGGSLFADPVECLLDLHEARLEPQALELLNMLIGSREQTQ
jgi:CRP-like cAMP-binding protein